MELKRNDSQATAAEGPRLQNFARVHLDNSGAISNPNATRSGGQSLSMTEVCPSWGGSASGAHGNSMESMTDRAVSARDAIKVPVGDAQKRHTEHPRLGADEGARSRPLCVKRLFVSHSKRAIGRCISQLIEAP